MCTSIYNKALKKKLGKLDIIAEDLGYLTDDVRKLLKSSNQSFDFSWKLIKSGWVRISLSRLYAILRISYRLSNIFPKSTFLGSSPQLIRLHLKRTFYYVMIKIKVFSILWQRSTFMRASGILMHISYKSKKKGIYYLGLWAWSWTQSIWSRLLCQTRHDLWSKCGEDASPSLAIGIRYGTLCPHTYSGFSVEPFEIEWKAAIMGWSW